MFCISLFLAVLSFFSMTLAAPHTGMINNDYVLDVGAVYPQVGYGGDASFLLSVRAEPTCMSFNGNIASVTVCVRAACAFYTSADCGQTERDHACTFTVEGPGDVQDVPEHLQDIQYGSYICATNRHIMGAVTSGESLKTTPHDASKDKSTTMN